MKHGTGYVTIRGAGLQTWIDSEFPLVKNYLGTEGNLSTLAEDEAEKIDAETKTVAEADAKERGKPKTAIEEIKEEIEQLWGENTSLKNAVRALEEGMKKQSCKCKDNVIDEQLISKRLVALEKSYDEKLTTYTEALEKKFREELKEAKKVMKKKLSDIEDDFNNVKTMLVDEDDEEKNEPAKKEGIELSGELTQSIE